MELCADKCHGKYPGEQAYDGGGKNNSEAAPIAGGEYIETQIFMDMCGCMTLISY